MDDISIDNITIATPIDNTSIDDTQMDNIMTDYTYNSETDIVHVSKQTEYTVLTNDILEQFKNNMRASGMKHKINNMETQILYYQSLIETLINRILVLEGDSNKIKLHILNTFGLKI